MAETKTAPSATSPTMVTDGKTALEKPASPATPAPTGAALAFTGGPPMGFRALVGFSGLSLLVGFFLPWFRAAAEGEHQSGLTMMLGDDVGGTPAMLLVAVPILGVLLSAAAFMGFRWTAHSAIGVASLLLAYGLWVLLRLFVEHTALGLWVVVGGAFITLLLGVVTLLYTRDRVTKQGVKPVASDAKK
jgi:hypothetical protein